MADESKGAHDLPKDGASERKLQTGGRQANAAGPLSAAKDRGGLERYPPVNQTDVVEPTGRGEEIADEARSFGPGADAPTRRQGAGDASPDLRHMGPDGDPAEGKP